MFNLDEILIKNPFYKGNKKLMNLKENFPFLFATRFWVMVAVTIMGILKVKDFIDPEVANVLISFGLGFIGVRSLDRASEKVGEVKVTQLNEI